MEWLTSYLTDRVQTVKIDDACSSEKKLLFGVPQGSVLGPILFSLYSSPVAAIARKHGLTVQLYADDTQLYLAFHPVEADDALARVEACIAEIKQWMVKNKLQLNSDKTLVLLFGSPRQGSSSCSVEHVLIDGHPIPISVTAKNLGVIFDEHLNMNNHIKAICRGCMFQLRNISRIRRLLPMKTAEQLIHAFVMSKLDYCNSLLFGLPSTSIGHLQRIQNIAARILTRTKKFDHITPVLTNLHWLPIEQRIVFKLMLLTYRAVNDMAPEYIKELIVPHKPARSLRSSCAHKLSVPRSRLKGYGDRCFSIAAPRLWNELPEDLRTASSLTIFKSGLKTHLFKIFN